MAHTPEEEPLEEEWDEFAELTKEFLKLPPDAVDTSDLEDDDESPG